MRRTAQAAFRVSIGFDLCLACGGDSAGL